MKRYVRTLVATAAVAAAPCAGLAADRVVPPAVPAGLDAPAGFKAFLSGHAIGTQNYICAPGAGGPKWLFVGPQATVYDADAKQILTHFQSTNPHASVIQATWQDSRDTSAVWAKRFAGSIDAAFVAADAIEWLLLEYTWTQSGPTAGDRLTGTRWIQRVNTVGGKEPSTPCTDANYNDRRLVPYEADYYFYR